VIAAIREDAASLFQNDIQVCDGAIIQFSHSTSPSVAIGKALSERLIEFRIARSGKIGIIENGFRPGTRIDFLGR